MKFGLEQHIIDKLIVVFEQHSKVDKALVFGSRAKGNYRPDSACGFADRSDIDIAIKGQDLHTDDIIAMSVAFEEKGITHKIDLINYQGIQEPDLKDHIDRVGIELYSRWKEYRFSDFALINPTISLKGNEEYSFVEMKDLKDGSKICSPSVKRKTSSGARFQERDTLFARITPCLENGKICQVRGLENGIGFGSTEFLVFRGREYISDNDFVFYMSRWDDVRDFAENNFEGTSGRQRVPKNCFDNLILDLPPLNEQTAIATILSSLDDKIDLLHRQNKTLEQLAETLFRQWFVEEAEESWEEVALSEIAVHSKENVHPSKNPTKIYKHYSLPSFDAGKEPINEIGKEILSNKYKVISNSILVSKLNPRTPRIWMIYGNVNEDECICSTEFQIVKPKDPKWYGFIYCFLKSNQVTQELAGASSGTSGSHQRVNPQDIFNLTFLKPTDVLIEEFSKVMNNYLVKININQTQIRTLTNTRDTLLPKLMSGEVRVNL